ncbi:MAG: NAD(P)-dependent oxidoreductase [Coriobacteriia bacterium]|nr:NAD(P)-dependent oxidoreductase [Coriobacteriia bacterium]
MTDLAATKPTVAFIGTGVMGAPMAGHLMDAGYPLVVFNRTKSRADALVARGATWADSPGEAAVHSDVVVTMVGYPADVEAVYLAPGGIVERARDGAVLLDMTTSSPALAERVSAAAASRGIVALDAPVSGGDVGAKNATLTIMVGGEAAAYERIEPLLRVMGANVVLQGGPGAGQHTKMANQVAIAGSMLATVESLGYAQAAGLDPRRVLESIGAGSAASWSLANLAPRILDGNFGPGFYVKHFVKDLRIALASAEESGIDLPGCALAKQLYEHLEANGGQNLGTQALWLLYSDAATREAAGVGGSATTLSATVRTDA